MSSLTCPRCGKVHPIPDPVPMVVSAVCDACAAGVSIDPAAGQVTSGGKIRRSKKPRKANK